MKGAIPTIDRVREAGFSLAKDWFDNEASASTFVLNHQGEVERSLVSFPVYDDEDVVKAWEAIHDQLLAIPPELIQPWQYTYHLVRDIVPKSA